MLAVKQPWQMTCAEWQREIDATKINFTGTGGDGKYGMGRSTRTFNTGVERRRFLRFNLPDVDMGEGLIRPANHSDIVRAAVSARLPVPADVLGEYPDLA